jgi:ArsR family transcriptional regulator, lead/cadmium/zinc/bismuth-responsive transcriptional repressor
LLRGHFVDIFTDVQMLHPSDPTVSALASTFRLLGDPTRVRILMALDEHHELCVHEIADRVGATETKVSQALRLLRTAGIVRNRRDGRHIHYRLDDDHVRTLLRVTTEHLEHGGDR